LGLTLHVGKIVPAIGTTVSLIINLLLAAWACYGIDVIVFREVVVREILIPFIHVPLYHRYDSIRSTPAL
jgi:hypothetical protein